MCNQRPTLKIKKSNIFFYFITGRSALIERVKISVTEAEGIITGVLL
jgi:hypothetical protein